MGGSLGGRSDAAAPGVQRGTGGARAAPVPAARVSKHPAECVCVCVSPPVPGPSCRETAPENASSALQHSRKGFCRGGCGMLWTCL